MAAAITDHAFTALVPGANACGVQTPSGHCLEARIYHQRAEARVVVPQPVQVTVSPGYEPRGALSFDTMNHACPACEVVFLYEPLERPLEGFITRPGGWQAFRDHLPQCIHDHADYFREGTR